MPRQESRKDRHSRRIATDADYWDNWLERLAELRRETARDESLSRTEMPIFYIAGPGENSGCCRRSI
jgi:hypothetical protein